MGKEQFAVDFRRIRERLGLSQKELGDLLGKSPASIQSYEDAESVIFPVSKIWPIIKEVMGIDVQEYKYPNQKCDMRQAGTVNANNSGMVNVGGDNVTMGHRAAYMVLTPEERDLIESLRLGKIVKANG